MEVVDIDHDRQIEESFYEERERLRKQANSNLPVKSHDHSLLARNKKFFNDSAEKESPKFSPLNDQEPRHDRITIPEPRNKSLTGVLTQQTV